MKNKTNSFRQKKLCEKCLTLIPSSEKSFNSHQSSFCLLEQNKSTTKRIKLIKSRLPDPTIAYLKQPDLYKTVSPVIRCFLDFGNIKIMFVL